MLLGDGGLLTAGNGSGESFCMDAPVCMEAPVAGAVDEDAMR